MVVQYTENNCDHHTVSLTTYNLQKGATPQLAGPPTSRSVHPVAHSGLSSATSMGEKGSSVRINVPSLSSYVVTVHAPLVCSTILGSDCEGL
jgi:hypothetical protein